MIGNSKGNQISQPWVNCLVVLSVFQGELSEDICMECSMW